MLSPRPLLMSGERDSGQPPASVLPPGNTLLSVLPEHLSLKVLAAARTDSERADIWRPVLQKYLQRLRLNGHDLDSFPGPDVALDVLFESAASNPNLYMILIPILVLAAKSRYFYVVRDVYSAIHSFRVVKHAELPDADVIQRAFRYAQLPVLAPFFANLFRHPVQADFRCPKIEFVQLFVVGLYSWSTPDGLYVNVYAENSAGDRRTILSNSFCLFVQILREMGRYYARHLRDDFICDFGDADITEWLKRQGFNFRGHLCPWQLAAELLFVGGSIPMECAEPPSAHPCSMLQVLELRLVHCVSLDDLPLMKPNERKNINLKWSDYETEYDFSYHPQVPIRPQPF